jgi:hypothetical protein
MTLPRVPKDLTLWTQPWCLTYILKTNTRDDFSIVCTRIWFIVTKPFHGYWCYCCTKKMIWRCELSIWPIFQKLWCRHGFQWNLSLWGAFVFHKHILFSWKLPISTQNSLGNKYSRQNNFDFFYFKKGNHNQ